MSLVFFAFSMTPTLADLASEMNKKFKPDTTAHSFSWHGGLIDNRSMVGLQLNLAYSETIAWRLSNNLALHTSERDDSSIRYLGSDVAASALVFRTPLLKDFLRTYAVSEINLNFEFYNKKIVLAYSWRGGFEIFTAQHWSVFAEIGIQVPFYRQKEATVSSGAIALLGGNYYF